MKKSTVRRRANGEGTVFRNVRGGWRGAVSYEDVGGTSRRRYVSGTTENEVRRKVTALRSELDKGRRPTAPTTLGDYLEGWLERERAGVRPSTWRYRSGHVRLYIVPALGKAKIADLMPQDVERMTSGMVDRGLAARTAAGCRTTLRKALGDALRDGLVHRNVAALARPPRIPGREVEYLDRTELRRLLDAASEESLGPIVALAATTGLRQGELLGLSWTDVSVGARTLTVRRSMAAAWGGGYALAEPKTSRSRRTVHVPALAVAALERQRERQDADRRTAGPDWLGIDNLVFTDELGRPLRGDAVSHGFSGMLQRAGVRHVPFHALRHSWATLALASGVPLKVIADNLGHASISVTAAFYSGLVPALNRDAADAIGRALA